jgi:hypothetical protein
MPSGRAQGFAGRRIIVDSQGRYAYTFARQAGRGHVETLRRGLPAGDYAVEHEGRIGRGGGTQVPGGPEQQSAQRQAAFAPAELLALPRAAVVVEDRYSGIFELEHVRQSVVADALPEAQVRHPSVPIVFAETRPLAEEWTYRFLAAGIAQLMLGAAAEPTVAQVRAWVVAQGLAVSDRGRRRPEVREAYRTAHSV